MAANKVVFGNKVLIDLTGDTVTEEALLKGYTAHKADGTIITGTAFAGYPNEFVFLDNIEDSSHDSHIVNSRAVLPSRCSSSGAVVALQSLEIFRCPFVVQFLDCDRRFQVIRILIKFHKSCVCIIVCWKV